MPIPKPLLLSALGAAGLAASVAAQQTAPVPVVAPVEVVVGEVRLEVSDDDQPPPRPPVPPRPAAVAQSAPRAPMVLPPHGAGGPWLAQGGLSGGGMTIYRTHGDDHRTHELAHKLAAATDDEARDKLRGELKAALGKAFDERLKGQEQQVAELEKQLERLKDTVDRRKEAWAAILADRLVSLEKEAKGLGW